MVSHQPSSHSSGLEVPTRACEPCAERRVRCSRGIPCKQCIERRTCCTYPASNSRGKRKRVVQHDREDTSVDTGLGSALPSTSATNSGLCLLAASQSTTFDGPVATQPTDGPPTVLQSNRQSNGAASVEPQFSEMLQQSMILAPDIGVGEDIAYGIIDTFSPQAMELLSINWLSPDYQAELQLSEQLANMQNVFPPAGVGFPSCLDPAPVARLDRTSRVDQRSLTSQSTIPSQCRDTETLSIHSAQSPAVSHVSGHSSNRFYVDGDGARASLRPPWPSNVSPSSSPCISDPHAHTNTTAESAQACLVDEQLSSERYRVLTGNLQSESSNFTANELPSYEQVSQWVRLYLEYFHPTFPFLMKMELFDVNSDWVLLLAVATLGAVLSTSSEAGRVRHLLMDTLAQVVTHRLESVQSRQDIGNNWILPAAARRENLGDLGTVQAAVLNIVCLLHCGRKDKISCAMAERHRLVDVCHSMQLLSASIPQFSDESAGDFRRWCRDWYQAQASIRLGLMIWASHPVDHRTSSPND